VRPNHTKEIIYPVQQYLYVLAGPMNCFLLLFHNIYIENISISVFDSLI